MGVALAGTASAQTIVESFSDFASTTGLKLNGSATTIPDGQVLRLVSDNTNLAGSAFTTSQVSVNGFSTAFQFQLTNPGPSTNTDPAGQFGADGLTFTIQTVANTALGATGEGLGYEGIGGTGQNSPHSVAVEFDTWQNNDVRDPSSNHLGVDLNGSMTSLATATVSPQFDNGTIWTAWIDYNPTTHALQIRVSDGSGRPADPTLTETIDLASTSYLGSSNAFVGFTAGTGSDYANHDILNWAYSSTFEDRGISPVPEPATYELMLVGAAMAWLSRRRRRLRPAR